MDPLINRLPGTYRSVERRLSFPKVFELFVSSLVYLFLAFSIYFCDQDLGIVSQ